MMNGMIGKFEEIKEERTREGGGAGMKNEWGENMM